MPGNSYLFREYIGAQFKNVKFADVPVNPDVNFHFILSFAIDYTTSQTSPSPANGVFSPFWDTANLTPADVAAIKAAHPNASVMLSVGGDSVQDIVKAFFQPTSVDSWVSNAVSSLTDIINQYDLDGVDVDYEHFQADTDTFTECIGQLLTRLKANTPTLATSIAPFEDPEIQRYYQAVWSKYASVIDYVNFQFYAYGSNTTVEQYIGFYDMQSANYSGGNILASFITGNVAGVITPELGLSACKALQGQNKLFGIFIWSADSSKASSVGFEYETRAQEILARN